MKRFVYFLSILALWLFSSVPLYCQDYLNIFGQVGSDRNIPFALLQEIRFNEIDNKINFILADATAQTVTFDALQNISFDDVGAGTLLPVELVAFTATVNRATVALSWKTATEVNNYGFEIERRTESNNQSSGSSWKKVGFVQGNGTSNTSHSYSFQEENNPSGTYAYRLKQIDNDGEFKYSHETEVTIGVPRVFALSQNYPNPFNPKTTIIFDIPTESFVTIKVYSVVGKETITLVHENKKAGSYKIIFDGSQLASGMYVCRMTAPRYSSATKMILLK